LKRISLSEKGSYAAALGLFDGVHKGHRAVLCDTLEIAEKEGLTPAAITFIGQTMTGKGCKLLLTETEKRAKMSEIGIKAYYSFSFDDVKEMTPREFAKLLCEKFGVKYVICGEDFRFGHGKSGDTAALIELGRELGFGVRITPERLASGEKISSCLIREKISAGEIENANALLGYEYYCNLTVVNGNKIGRSIGFPTINQIIPKSLVTPKFGVYLSKTEVNGKVYSSLSNIGIKPTVEYTGKPLIETYIKDFDGDLYGRKIKVSFLSFVRSEQHFSGLTELKEQIQKDKLFMKENYD
jgi:riboflavin kinase/FMN adenylyltransferase